MEELYNLPKNLKRLRKENNLTQKQVAEKLGIKHQSYQAYENGLSVPTLQNFIKLTKVFEVTYEELLEN